MATALKPRKKKVLFATELFKMEGRIRDWYPREGETAHDYYVFKLFLDLGVTRSMKEVADITKIAPAVVRQIAEINDWEDRVTKYDRHVVELEFEARDQSIVTSASEWEARRTQVREKAFNNANRLIDKALQMLEFPLDVETTTTEISDGEDGTTVVTNNVVRMPARWSFRDVATLLSTADQLQRLAADMTTSNTKITVESRRLELTVKMVNNLISRGDKLPDIKRNLLATGVSEVDLDEALKQVAPSLRDEAQDAEFTVQ